MKYVRFALICIAAIIIWVILAGYGAFYGWWMTPVVEKGDHAAFHQWAVREIEANNRGNTAFMLLQRGEVVGEHYGQARNRVDRETLFPTASFSKWITALSVMSLVESGDLDLDAPVQEYLSRWQLPEGSYDNTGVTVRRLLSHTAGLTDRLGFGDYAADEDIPPVEDELRNPRASREGEVKIMVGLEPGSEFLYSGGGYLILQLIVEEITGDTFAAYVGEQVLQPLGMSRSSYEYLAELENTSRSFETDGSEAPTYQYASAAATAFSSSASDLSKLVVALLSEADRPLSPATVVSMRQPEAFVLGAGIWGLGTMLYAETPQGDFVYGHDGANDPAINVSVRINPVTSDALILLISGHPTLASNIGSEWVLWQTGYPDFLSTERALRSAILPIAIGSLLILIACIIWFRRRR